MYYCVIITSLFCHYYIIMTNRKSCNDDSILTCYTKRQPPFLRYYCIITSLSQRGLLIGYYCSLLQSSELADGNVVLGLLPEVLLTLLGVGGVRAVCRTPPESLLPPLLVVPGLKCMNPGSPLSQCETLVVHRGLYWCSSISAGCSCLLVLRRPL